MLRRNEISLRHFSKERVYGLSVTQVLDRERDERFYDDLDEPLSLIDLETTRYVRMYVWLLLASDTDQYIVPRIGIHDGHRYVAIVGVGSNDGTDDDQSF